MGTELLRIGCAGWSLPADQQSRFPAGDSHLRRYASVFNAVEINSCFYRSHRKGTWSRWAESTPESFRFSYKLPKSITHEARLQGVRDLLSAFLDEITCLGSRQGTLLIQLPPSFAFDARVTTKFFSLLRKLDEERGIRHVVACEPRHPSWFTSEANRLLSELEVAGVAADPPRVGQEFTPYGFGGHIYFRMHGAPKIYYSDYGEAKLRDLSRRIAQSVAVGIETWCIFDNTAEGCALRNALRLMLLLSPN